MSVTVETEYDALQDSGEKLEFGATRRFTIHRPNRVRIDIEERDGSKKGVRFDGQSLSIFSADENVYATVAKTGTLDMAFARPVLWSGNFTDSGQCKLRVQFAKSDMNRKGFAIFPSIEPIYF